MRTPLAWLREYVDLPADATAVAARLATLGFPVDETIVRDQLSGVVAGRITKLEKHPNADRLQVCTIDVGGSQTLTIATAATNVAQGQTVPVATIGAKLWGGLAIAPRKMRGIDSEGMLCSAEELGLPAEWFEDGIMQLEHAVPLGTDLIAMFGLNDPIFDVDVTTNRPDALSVVGLARELAAAYNVELRMPETYVNYDLNVPDDVRVSIETLDCRRFVYQRASGLRVRPAKTWMRVRLALAGQRPINNVVDISNFVMLELGQPMHFFDADRIAGKRLTVRDAKDGERFTTLDDQERELDRRMIVICDNEGPTSLAGVMGGQRSEVVPETKEVLIEAAAWNGARIRRTAKALKLRTEASNRFEKGLPVALADVGAARAARLLEQEGASMSMPHAEGRTAPERLPVTLHTTDIQRLLGFTVAETEIERALTSLGFGVKRERDAFAVMPPFWRGDVTIAADLVEEVARVVGYDRVTAEVPPVMPHGVSSAEWDRETLVAQTLAGLGYTEFVTLPLQPGTVAETWRGNGVDIGTPVEITNPLSEDQRWMRFSLAPALLQFAARDRAVRPYRIFEIGHVFSENGADPNERGEVTVLNVDGDAAYGKLASDLRALVRAATGADALIERAQAPGLHPGKTAALTVGGTAVGWVGHLDPRLARAYDLPAETSVATVRLADLPKRVTPKYVEPSKFPAIERDLAVVVGEDVAAADLVSAARAEPLVVAATVFDQYRGPQVGEGKKSLALRLTLQSREATLTDESADAAISRVVASLRERHGAAPRT